MTKEQQERFLERVGRFNKIVVTTPDRDFTLFELDMPDTFRQMFLALVKIAVKMDNEFQFNDEFCQDLGSLFVMIESASGLPWFEDKKVYEECIQ